MRPTSRGPLGLLLVGLLPLGCSASSHATPDPVETPRPEPIEVALEPLVEEPPAAADREPPVAEGEIPPPEPMTIVAPDDLEPSADDFLSRELRTSAVFGVPGGTMHGGASSRVAAPAGGSAKPALLLGGGSWNCPFPKEAGQDVDKATVVLVVSVSAAGKAERVKVVSEPGFGFGRAARQCALTQSYRAATDSQGNAIEGDTASLRVRFQR